MITVDTREKHISQIKSIIANMDPTDIKLCPEIKFQCLDLGDYHLENGDISLRVERKNISDFMGTYPKLKERLHDMRLRYDRTALLLEGVYSVRAGRVHVMEGNQLQGRMDYSTFSNFLAHQAEAHTWLIHTMTLEESIYRLIHIHNYLPKLGAPTPVIKCGSPAEWLVQLPGIGPGTIQKMKAAHETPISAINDGLPKKAKELLQKW